MKDSDCIAFLQWALPCLGHRWPGYRKVRRQVCKRVDRRIRALGLAGIEEYRAYLETHRDEWARSHLERWLRGGRRSVHAIDRRRAVAGSGPAPWH
jgi:hypothetical protein